MIRQILIWLRNLIDRILWLTWKDNQYFIVTNTSVTPSNNYGITVSATPNFFADCTFNGSTAGNWENWNTYGSASGWTP